MNEEAREEQSVVGKAVSTAAVGGGIYGAHRGLRSDTAYNWGSKKAGQGSKIGKGVVKYNEKADDLKNYLYKKHSQRYGYGYSSDDIYGSYSASGSSGAKQATGKPVGKSYYGLKNGLSDEALANQVHLDNLRNTTKAGKKTADVVTTPSAAKIITSNLDDFAKSVTKIK